MDLLSTASALLCILCVAAGAFLGWQANSSANDARDSADELRATQGRVKSHDLSIESLYSAVKRIDGKIGAIQRRLGPTVRGEPFDDFVESARGADTSYAGADQLDPELEAALALQRAPSRAPGSNGA